MDEWVVLAISIATCMAAALIGGFFTARAVKEWYPSLKKPSWNPPSWAFGPIWTILYILMAISAWLVWKEGGLMQQIIPLSLFGIQLIFNVVWSWLFFYKRSIRGGLYEIVMLWILILATLLAFWSATIIAGLLFVPYLVWVSIASYLNYTVWKLNPPA